MRLPGSSRVNISGVTSSLGHSRGHMTLTSKPRNLSTVQDESMGGEKIESPMEPPRESSDEAGSKSSLSLRKSVSVGETSSEKAARWNQSASTLILDGPAAGISASGERGRRQSLPALDREGSLSSHGDASMPVSASLSSRSFSLVGLPQGPSPLHLAAK